MKFNFYIEKQRTVFGGTLFNLLFLFSCRLLWCGLLWCGLLLALASFATEFQRSYAHCFFEYSAKIRNVRISALSCNSTDAKGGFFQELLGESHALFDQIFYRWHAEIFFKQMSDEKLVDFEIFAHRVDILEMEIVLVKIILCGKENTVFVGECSLWNRGAEYAQQNAFEQVFHKILGYKATAGGLCYRSFEQKF